MSSTTIKYFNPDGVFVDIITDFISLEYGRQLNDIGACTILMDLGQYDPAIFIEDALAEIWREENGVITLVGDTLWLLQGITYSTTEDCVSTIELLFLDALSLLTRRFTMWYAADEPPYASFTNLSISDTILDYYNHNMGEYVEETRYTAVATRTPPTAITRLINGASDRNINNIGVQGYYNAGATTPVVAKASSFEPLLKVLQDVANTGAAFGFPTYFDIVYTPAGSTIGTLRFSVREGHWGTNRTIGQNRLVFSTDHGNIVGVQLTFDYTNSANVVYGLGNTEIIDGDASLDELPLVVVYDKNYNKGLFSMRETVIKFNENSESTENWSSTGSGDPTFEMLLQAATGELYNRVATPVLGGTIVQAPSSQLFINYSLGDLCVVHAFGYEFIAEIRSFQVKVDNTGEKISVPLVASNFEGNLLEIVQGEV